MNKDSIEKRDIIRFFPDGSTEIQGKSIDKWGPIAEIAEDLKEKQRKKKGMEIWGNLSVGQLPDSPSSEKRR